MDSTDIKIQNMASLSEYRGYLQKNPRLAYLFLELTDQCNLSCLHCGSSCSGLNHAQLDFDLAEKALDSVARRMDPEKIMVCFTGGEPLMYRNFFELAEYTAALGFPWGMTSNATLITPETAARLAECGMGSISVSLDGMEQNNDWFRNRKGAFRDAVEGIRALRDRCEDNFLLQVTTVAHKRNMDELENVYGLLAELNIRHWRIINIDPIGRAKEHPELLPDADDFKRLFDYIRGKRRSNDVGMNVTYGCSHFLTTEYEREVRDYYFICGAGIYVASILCNGDIASCLDIERRPELVQGNIRTDDLVDVWNSRFEIFRTDRTGQCRMCAECGDRLFCNADSTHTWNFDEKRPNLCLRQMWADAADHKKVVQKYY